MMESNYKTIFHGVIYGFGMKLEVRLLLVLVCVVFFSSFHIVNGRLG